MAEVWINGEKAGESLWGPFVFDVTRQLKKGENTIKVRIGNLIVNKLWTVSDMGFMRLWSWRNSPELKDFDAGLYGPVKIMITK